MVDGESNDDDALGKKNGLFPIPLAKTVHMGFSMKGCTYC
jgi:hypothetical protein